MREREREGERGEEDGERGSNELIFSLWLTCLVAADPRILCVEAIMPLSSSTLQYSPLPASAGHIIQVNGNSGRTPAKGSLTNGYSIWVFTEL